MAAKKKTFNVGDRVEVLSTTNTNNAGFAGITSLISRAQSGQFNLVDCGGHWFMPTDLKIIADIFTVEEITTQKIELQKNLAILETKLEYMRQFATETGSENEFKVWQTMVLFDSKTMTKQQKARAIASLLDT